MRPSDPDAQKPLSDTAHLVRHGTNLRWRCCPVLPYLLTMPTESTKSRNGMPPHWPCEGCRQRAMCGLRPTNSAEQPSTKDTCRKVQAYTGDSQHVD